MRAAEGTGDAFGTALTQALREAGVEPPVAEGELRGWAAEEVTDDDLPHTDLPPLDDAAEVPVDMLTAAGVRIELAQQTEAILRGNQLPLARFTLTPVQRFRLRAALHGDGTSDPALDPALALALDTALAAAVARRLGVAVTVAGPDGVVAEYGVGADRSVLLVRDGDGYLAGAAAPAREVVEQIGAPPENPGRVPTV
ncbi:hypothetical protein ACWV95_28805 [Streptomyces albus]